MQLELPRTGLNGSALVDLLAQLALADRPAPPPPPSFVEGLGRWLGWKDAIALSAVLQGAAAPLDGSSKNAQGAVHGNDAAAALQRLEAAFARTCAALVAALDAALTEVAAQDNGDFLPWRRLGMRLQQAMESAAGALRAQARAVLQTLAASHPSLGTLAALDATLAQALAPREQAQLALMPVLMERHHRRGRRPDGSTPAAFRDDMRRLLLAEFDLRLQPACGLLDALRAEMGVQGGAVGPGAAHGANAAHATHGAARSAA